MTQIPNLAWELDGAPAAPRALRPVASVRPDEMLPANRSPDEVPRAFTGVYEFEGLQPDTLHTVTVHTDGDSQTLASPYPAGRPAPGS